MLAMRVRQLDNPFLSADQFKPPSDQFTREPAQLQPLAAQFQSYLVRRDSSKLQEIKHTILTKELVNQKVRNSLEQAHALRILEQAK